MDNKEYGRRIRMYREKLKKSQTELSREVGCQQSNISQIELGKIEPNLELLTDICTHLETTPDAILLGTRNSKGVPWRIYEKLELLSSENIHIIELIINALIDDSVGQK